MRQRNRGNVIHRVQVNAIVSGNSIERTISRRIIDDQPVGSFTHIDRQHFVDRARVRQRQIRNPIQFDRIVTEARADQHRLQFSRRPQRIRAGRVVRISIDDTDVVVVLSRRIIRLEIKLEVCNIEDLKFFEADAATGSANHGRRNH